MPKDERMDRPAFRRIPVPDMAAVTKDRPG